MGLAMPNENIAEMFFSAARRGPARPALRVDDKSYSYRELADRALEISGAVRRNDSSGLPVALLVERRYPAYCAILGILASGSAYVPLSPKQPWPALLERLALIGARTVIVDEPVYEAASASLRILSGMRILVLDEQGRIRPGSAVAR